MKNESELVTNVPKFKMIKYGEEFEAWPDSRKINYLKKLASSMNHAADLMQQERNEIAEEIKVIKEQMDNAEKNLAIQKGIVLKVITDGNVANQDHINRIQLLERKLREKDETIENLQIELTTQELR